MEGHVKGLQADASRLRTDLVQVNLHLLEYQSNKNLYKDVGISIVMQISPQI